MTLIELLIVISLVGMISLAIYQTFHLGLQVWERQSRIDQKQDVFIFLDKITEDLHNATYFSKISFEGSLSHFAFPAIITTVNESVDNNHDSGVSTQVGKVEYYFDASNKTIFRRQAIYGQALKDMYDPPRALVPSIDQLAFRFIYITDNGATEKQETSDTLPSFVEVRLTYQDHGVAQSQVALIQLPLNM